MPPLNLVDDAWIPVIRRSGRKQVVRPCDVTDGFAEDPVTDFDWPRADLRTAQLEFMLGLLSTTVAPRGHADWRRWWDAPPDPAALADAFAPVARAFDVDRDGPGPRFLQDLAPVPAEPSPVERLLMDQPGANALVTNGDWFVRRGAVPVMGASTAAIALMALQLNASSGGTGYRTGIRGGGPLVTLALPPDDDTLWRRLWLNHVQVHSPVRDGDPLDEPARTFPWMGPTRTSEGTGKGKDKVAGTVTAPSDCHPTQVWWGMPRRVRLVVEPNVDGQPCSVTGRVEDHVVRSFATVNYGTNYVGDHDHPLTPHYRAGDPPEWLPTHVSEDTGTYRKWAGFLHPDRAEGATTRPARVLALAAERLRRERPGATGGVLGLGYDMANAKSLGYVEAHVPFHVLPDAARQEAFDAHVLGLVRAAEAAASILYVQVSAATQGVVANGLKSRFLDATEGAFWAAVDDAAQARGADAERSRDWVLGTLRATAEAAFDDAVRLDDMIRSADQAVVQRMVDARRMLIVGLLGHGAAGARLHAAAGLAPPESAKARKARATEANVKARQGATA